MSDNKIEINFSILDNLHNFEHYTYMTQTVIKAIFINTVNYQRDNLCETQDSGKAHFTRVTEVVESCQMCWISNGMQHICNKYATRISMICIGHFQRNLGMSFLRVPTSGVAVSEYFEMMLASIEKYLLSDIARQRDMSKIATQSANDRLELNFVNRIYKLLNIKVGIYFLGQCHCTGVSHNLLDNRHMEYQDFYGGKTAKNMIKYCGLFYFCQERKSIKNDLKNKNICSIII